MTSATRTTEFHDAVHAVALDRMRRKHRPGYRWWMLLTLAAALIAVWAFCF